MGLFSRWFKRKTNEDQELLKALSSNDEQALELISAKPSKEQQVLMLQAGFHEMVSLVQSIRTHMDQQVNLQQKLLDSMEHLPSAVEGLSQIGKATEQQTQALGQFNSTLASMESANRQSAEMIKTIMARSESRMMKLVMVLVVLCLALLGTGIFFGVRGFPVISTDNRIGVSGSQQPVVGENDVPEAVGSTAEQVEMAMPTTEDQEKPSPSESPEAVAEDTSPEDVQVVPSVSPPPDDQELADEEPMAEEVAGEEPPAEVVAGEKLLDEKDTDEELLENEMNGEDPLDEKLVVDEGTYADETDLSIEEETMPLPEDKSGSVLETEELSSSVDVDQ